MHIRPLWLAAALWIALTAAHSLVATPVAIAPNFKDAQQPQLAIASDGNIYIAFGLEESVFVARSSDGGAHFQPPVKVATLPNLSLGLRRGPRISVVGKKLTVLAAAGDLLAFQSTDGGATWSQGARVNTVPMSAREGLHALATGPHGEMYTAWLDQRAGSMEIYGASSVDDGKSWKEELVYRSPSGHVCECCNPSAAYNAKGDLVVMWRNTVGSSRDLWTALRPRGNEHFAAPSKMGTGTWKISGCPMDGGSVFASSDTSFASVWRRDKDVYFSRGTGDEHQLGRGMQPFVAVTSTATHVWWQQDNDLVHAVYSDSMHSTLFAPNAKFGSAVVLPNGVAVAVAFEQVHAGETGIYFDVLR